MQSVATDRAGAVVLELAQAIQANRAYLSEIDGAIGDGDHGINMSKGFTTAAAVIGSGMALGPALARLGETLMEGVGGSMGPLYGAFFSSMAEVVGGRAELDAETFSGMLAAARSAVEELGGAKVGDKTLLDALVPAGAAFDQAHAAGLPFATCLERMAAAACAGRDSTRDLVARVGRASRLGERSRGVLDAGATSCCLILETFAGSFRRLLAG
jgi:phosphoenolpyruvate---glycerone phosphotransferase subunit DhaL